MPACMGRQSGNLQLVGQRSGQPACRSVSLVRLQACPLVAGPPSQPPSPATPHLDRSLDPGWDEGLLRCEGGKRLRPKAGGKLHHVQLEPVPLQLRDGLQRIAQRQAGRGAQGCQVVQVGGAVQRQEARDELRCSRVGRAPARTGRGWGCRAQGLGSAAESEAMDCLMCDAAIPGLTAIKSCHSASLQPRAAAHQSKPCLVAFHVPAVLP